MTRNGPNGSRAAFSDATLPGLPSRQLAYLLPREALRSAGLPTANAPAWRGAVTWPAAPLRGDRMRRRSNNPPDAAPRCIQGVLHCKEGMPCLPACSETELALLRHSVNRRTRSWDLESRNWRATELSFIGAKTKVSCCTASARSEERRVGKEC